MSEPENSRQIVGAEGYRIDQEGGVWCCRKLGGKLTRSMPTANWRRLKGSVNSEGYVCVGIRYDFGYKTKKVHVLVLEAFIGPRPPGMEGCHNNGNPSDNRLSNLRWDTHTGNMGDQVAHGTTNRGERSGRAKLVPDQVIEIRRLHASGVRQRAIAAQFGVSINTIKKINCGQRWQHLAIGS